jgi:hypothetical protein
MSAMTRSRPALFVERDSNQWVVRDPDGNFWIMPAGNDPWDQRQPYLATEESSLEPVPGHYIHMLNLPF